MQNGLNGILAPVGVGNHRYKPRATRSAYSRMADAKLSDALCVKDFGARGDDRADDTKAFQNAVNTLQLRANGGTLLVPAGTYRIDRVNIAGIPNFKMLGEGRGISRIRFIGTGVNQPAFSVTTGFTTNGFTEFEDITWVAPTVSTTARAVEATDAAMMFRGCLVDTGYSLGFKLTGCFAFTMKDCIFQSTGDFAVYAATGSGQNGLFDNCRFFGCGITASSGAIYNESAENTIFRSCDFEANRIDIHLQDCTSQLITGCYQENNVSGTVLWIAGTCKGVWVEHGWYYNAGSGGDLVIQNVDGFTFRNNTLAGAFSITLGSAASNIECLPHHNVAFTGWSGSMITRDRDTSTSIVLSDRSGADVSTAQNIFDSATDTLTLEASTTYEFEAQYIITRSAGTTSHTTAVLFGGTATMTAMTYIGEATNAAGGALANVQQIFQQALTAAILTAASTSATEVVIARLRGILRVNAAGTLIPQFQFSAAPGGTPTIKAGSYFKARKISASGAAAIGAWA